MADGPSHEPLFREMKCLNAEANLPEIIKYLRFTKDEGANYQVFLAHYLPMLVGKPEIEEFIGDLEDKGIAKGLKPVEVVASVEAPKKRGPKAKVK